MEFFNNEDEDDDFYENIEINPNYLINFNQDYNNTLDNKIINGFKEISNRKISTTSNSLYNEIEKETSSIYSYFIEKVNKFPQLFERHLLSLDETYKYLESISKPNKCECAGIIDTIPGWRCNECVKYENSIYCTNCFIASKHLHKGHKIEFLYSSGGMCDCGDPDSLYTFCPSHCGPYTEQKEIDEYIGSIFPQNVLKNVKEFFDEFFMCFTKYFLLTEKCKYFYTEILEENCNNQKEKDDVHLLKNNFAIIFQNFLTFLFKITENNLGMMHLIASYFLKNNLPNENIDDLSKTTHSCIKIEKDDIKILYKNKNENEEFFSIYSFTGQNKHKCECPFLRLLFTNWRDNIKPYNKGDTQNEKFLLSFSHNLFLRCASAIILFFNSREIIFNYNSDDILYTRNQYFIEDVTELIAKKTNLIEDTYDFLYYFIKKVFDSPKSKDLMGGYKPRVIEKMIEKVRIFMYDSKYYTKPKIRVLMYSKTSILKRIIDIDCLIHKEMKYKSITPHPPFIEKKFVVELINAELHFIFTINIIYLYTDWENMDRVKEIFNYFIEKILYLQKNKNLDKNEFSFHLLIYRHFGAFLNFFCVNYALKNNIDINTAIDVVKSQLFKSEKEKQNIINLILNDYYKLFGFIIGIRNGYFNYYDVSNYNFIYFNDLRQLKTDFTLLKYLIALNTERINLEDILKISNIENVYTLFNNTFKPIEEINGETNKKENEQKEEKKGFSLFRMIKNLFNYGSSSDNQENEKLKKIFEEENKHVMQWRRILEIVISLLKNDTTPLTDILKYYEEVISIKTKSILFDEIKNNKYFMEECRNILKERLVQIFISNGNLMDLKGIKNGIDSFYFKLFEEKDFNSILDELTISKMNGEKKEFYIKDSCLNYLDMNYYYSPMTRAKAELYITDFKKDVFKIYNSYYYKPSKFTFDFYHKVYENILLNIENINLFIKIIENLLRPINEEDPKYIEINSVKKIILPVILSFISMLGSINSKTFIKFKIKNEYLINKISKILNKAINDNVLSDNKLLDNESAENIIEVIKQLNKYKLIREYIDDNFDKLNNNDYYTDDDFKDKANKDNDKNKINIIGLTDKGEEKKKNKAKNLKAHLNKIMKKQSDEFMKKAKKNKDMKKIIESKTIKESENEEMDEMMCFFCRNPINLKKFEQPYGKLGLIFDDYFYANSFKSTVNYQLNNILEENSNEKENLIYHISNNCKRMFTKNSRITSCGHYFHEYCFNKGSKSLDGFKCPLCEKLQNILIPPLINFYSQDAYLNPIKFIDILNNNKSDNSKEKQTINESYTFKNIIINYLEENIKLYFNKNENKNDYNNIIDHLLPKYQGYINFILNLFYSNGTTFHKQQQIEIIQNLLLSLRYMININYFYMDKIIYCIHVIIDLLIKGPSQNENIFLNFENMYYSDLFDKLLLLFSILLDSDELVKSFKYIIYWILPYISFFLYLRHLVRKNDFYTLYNNDLKSNINIDNIKQFLIDNNQQLVDYLRLYLQKLFIIKILTNYNNKNTEINCNIKELSLEQLFTLLNMTDLYSSLSKSDEGIVIIFKDLIENAQKLINPDSKNILFDYNDIFNLMINNVLKGIQSKYLVKAELIVQFIPYEFKFISLDNNIFDWIEKCLFKKCIMCKNNTKYYYICLICGEKICNTKICDRMVKHASECGGGSGAYIDIGNAKLTYIKPKKERKDFYSLYVNDSGVGPNDNHIGNEFYLSKEKYKLALKDYVSNDFL